MTNKARTFTIVVVGALMLMLIFLQAGPEVREGLREPSGVAEDLKPPFYHIGPGQSGS